MLAEMQKLAKHREELLRQRAGAEQHVAQCDAELITLHEEANAVYNRFQRNEQAHYSRIGRAHLFVILSVSLSGPHTSINLR